MRLSAINSTNAERNSLNINNKKNQKAAVNFKGGADMLVNFWQFVDNGGRALQFTVEDMFGTNIPRTYKGAMAGYKYTGKINVPALLQEGVREFLTGPTMCTVPILVLALAKKSGQTANTHIDNIINLSYLMQKTAADGKEIAENDFLKTVISDMLKKTSGNTASELDVDSMLGALEQYKDALNKVAQNKSAAKAQKKVFKQTAAKAMDNLQGTFERIIKQTKEDFKDTDFTQVKYSVSDTKESATGFKNYVNYITSYIEDFAKKFSKNGSLDATKENINAFKNGWIGKRILTIISMFAITGVMMSFIPKIYTKVSGNINPNAAAIYNEAEKENKTGKEVK